MSILNIHVSFSYYNTKLWNAHVYNEKVNFIVDYLFLNK